MIQIDQSDTREGLNASLWNLFEQVPLKTVYKRLLYKLFGRNKDIWSKSDGFMDALAQGLMINKSFITSLETIVGHQMELIKEESPSARTLQ